MNRQQIVKPNEYFCVVVVVVVVVCSMPLHQLDFYIVRVSNENEDKKNAN